MTAGKYTMPNSLSSRRTQTVVRQTGIIIIIMLTSLAGILPCSLHCVASQECQSSQGAEGLAVIAD